MNLRLAHLFPGDVPQDLLKQGIVITSARDALSWLQLAHVDPNALAECDESLAEAFRSLRTLDENWMNKDWMRIVGETTVVWEAVDVMKSVEDGFAPESEGP